MLSGYKTYITGIVGIVTAVGGFLSGTIQLPEAIQLGITSILGMTIRNGITQETK